jgi:polyhydroxyalkanoate synthesis repressor PhaR
MSVIATDSQQAKPWLLKEVLKAPIAQAAGEIQAGLLTSAGENSLFVLQCGGGSGSLPPLPAFAGANGDKHVADGHEQTEAESAAAPGETVIIKKYANRRLYNTAASQYVTLDHLSEMVRAGVDFIVLDAKSGDDITRSVLTQIIFEQESKGQNLLPVQFLRRLIRFYGDQMQGFLPPYLEMSMETFSKAQEKMRENMSRAFGATTPMAAFEEQTQRNMQMFQQALAAWTPFTTGMTMPQASPPQARSTPKSEDEDPQVAELRRQMEAMQKQLDAMAKR